MARVPQKGGGGNAHQRAVARAAAQRDNMPQESRKGEFPRLEDKVPPGSERVLRFFDSPTIQTLASIVGGLVGTFLDGRYFAALGLLVSFGLYRSKALAGVRPKIILPIHVISVLIAGAGLFYMGVQINKSRPQVYTPADYANAVKNSLPLPIVQQITNIYNSHSSSPPQKDEPSIDLQPFQLESFKPFSDQGTNLAVAIRNVGTSRAMGMTFLDLTSIDEMSNKSEDDLFKKIHTEEHDQDLKRLDVAPDRDHIISNDVAVPVIPPQDRGQFMDGKVLYLGVATQYSDLKGAKYQTELCVFWAPENQTLKYCARHNGFSRLGGAN